jgi:peptide chain release factor 2
MAEDTNDIEKEIEKLEIETQQVDFWNDKNKAQTVLKKIAELKDKKEGFSKYDKGNTIVNIISGAGGDDAEDFSRMLLYMYMKYADRRGWKISFIHENKNDHDGYRNVSFEIEGKNAYGMLKN